jgi:cell division protein FtsL
MTTVMTAKYAYRVIPESVKAETVMRETSPIILNESQRRKARESAFAAGIVVGFLALVGLAVLSQVFFGQGGDQYRIPILLCFLVISVVIIYFVSRGLVRHDSRKLKQQLQKARDEEWRRLQNSTEEKHARIVDLKKREAQELTKRLNSLLESSSEASEPLPQKLSNARHSIQRAEIDYQENAYGPFWDAVQETANDLAFFSRTAKELSKHAHDYYSLLEGRKHTFPIFPVRLESLPDPLPVSQEFRRVVRMGQTNFEFANIWEHRRTRDVLIAGFQTLGDAVNNLGGVLEQSLSNLRSATSSDIAMLVEAEIKTGRALVDQMREETHIAKEQSRMLDNIQHHRKPTF